jgi:hypothetical protein
MAKKKPKSVRAERLIKEAREATTWEEKIKILGKAAREAKTGIASRENLFDALKPILIELMETKEAVEYIFDRTLVRLDYPFALGKDKVAIEKYKKVVAVLGKDFAEELYTRVDTDIPQRTETTFPINQDKLKSLTKDQKRQLAKVLESKPNVYAGKPSKESKKRQSRRKTNKGS